MVKLNYGCLGAWAWLVIALYVNGWPILGTVVALPLLIALAMIWDEYGPGSDD